MSLMILAFEEQRLFTKFKFQIDSAAQLGPNSISNRTRRYFLVILTPNIRIFNQNAVQ